MHSKSNHSPNIIRNIQESINRRLSEISSDEAVFNKAATPYQEALYKSGYTYKVEFEPEQTVSSPRYNRSRKIIWFNPPYNRNVKSNTGREFLCLGDKCFPAGHKLRKIFNRNTLKLSYSCMPNVQQIINGRNQTVLKILAQLAQDQAGKSCNCRKKDECSLEGNCLSKGIVYQAKVTSMNRTETCLQPWTKQDFKTIKCRLTMKRAKTTQSLANISGSSKTNNTSTSNERSLPRRSPTRI